MPVSPGSQYVRRRKPDETLSGGSVQVGGQNVYYEASGVSECGPTILFLHESGGAAATWHGQLVGLAQAARCLVADLPGHGRSEGTGYRTVSEYRAALCAFLDALAIRWPVVVVGVCLGALIATDLAASAPERVAGLVLAGVSENGRAEEPIWRRTAQGEAPEGFVTDMFSSGANPSIVSRHLQRWRQTSPTVRHADLAAVRGYPVRQMLQAVPHPTLLVAGEQDPIATPAVAYGLSDALGRSRVALIPRASCLSMVEQPALFNQAVQRFVAELGPAGPILPDTGRPGGYRRT
ncbi:MAG: alpha/beta hydrolase fold protein [Symbiobacteriaceae bacterium]|jgi:pimeloyl-ACP methyl ester carboxylesterase|nr:alpha/beta hydrolase fold protein [Symbiobacteriaceae bacterium]